MNEENQNMEGGTEGQDAPGVPSEATPEAAPDMSQQPSPISGATASDMSMGSSKKSFGPLFGIIIIIVLLLLAGFYFWGQYLGNQEIEPTITADEIMTADDPVLDELETQSASDEIADIEADLDAGDLDALDAELESIDAELNF